MVLEGVLDGGFLRGGVGELLGGCRGGLLEALWVG